jgi:hypothetical protein
MAASAEYRSPRVIDVLLATLRHLPSGTRRTIRYILVAYVGLLLLKIWDARNSNGAGGVAEFASVILGTVGCLLLVLAHVLQRAGEPASIPGRPFDPSRTSGSPRATSRGDGCSGPRQKISAGAWRLKPTRRRSGRY